MDHCETCALSKATRVPFNSVSVRATKPLEIVHSDLAGPFETSMGPLSEKYYATFIDDYTGLLFAMPIINKEAKTVLAKLKPFQALAERVFGTKMMVLRTDGGTEYKGELGRYLAQQGITHQSSTPSTFQLNGVAERWNRTIKEMMTLLLRASGLELKLWAFCLSYAVWILNSTRKFEG